MSEIKRVLHIIPGFGGGISSHVRNIVSSIDKEYLILDVAGFTDYPEEFKCEVRAAGGTAFKLRNVRMFTLFSNIKELKHILKLQKYCAVHLHLTDKQALYFSLLCKISGIKRIIVHAHIAEQNCEATLFSRVKMKFNRKITVLAANDLASCSKLASEFRFGIQYVKHNRVMHIPNSIIAEKYFIQISEEIKKNYYNEFKIDSGQLVIGHVGYYGYQKNHPFMLRLIQRMAERKINFVWLFVGTGDDFDSTLSEAKRLNIESHIRFLGRRSDVNILYHIMDVSVLPSIFEGLPTVTIETQAAGTPTVISDNISSEVDMGLNMVKRLSLDASLDKWIDSIIQFSQITVPNQEIRIKNLEKRCFISNRTAELYRKFIYNEITTYNLSDEVDW